MLKKTIEYENFNGDKVKETLYFNMSKSELLRKENSTKGSWHERLKELVDKVDHPRIMEEVEALIFDAYGEKSSDGSKFMKNEEIRNGFKCSAAYDALLWELVSDGDKFLDFIKGLMPKEVSADMPNAIA